MKIIAPLNGEIHRVLLTTALSFGLALGGYSLAHAQVRQDTNEHQISYQTGGIGQEELDGLSQNDANYNAQFSFANASDRAYLNGLQVRIVDANQQTIFDDQEVGPLLYLQLNPGSYTITAINDGVEKQHQFTIKEGSKLSEVMTW